MTPIMCGPVPQPTPIATPNCGLDLDAPCAPVADLFDCAMGGLAGSAALEYEKAVDKNARLRRSGNPAKRAKASPKGQGPGRAATRWGKVARGAKVAGPTVSAAGGLIEGEGVGRVAVKTGFSVAGGEILGGLGVFCGPLAEVCVPAGAIGGGVVGGWVGGKAADVADAISDKAGDVIGGKAGNLLHSVFNK
jgi:hypothetical protein